MKRKRLFKILIMACSVFEAGIVQGQINLVNNPSFEMYDTCPNTAGQMSNSTGWYSSRSTPDYFNTCAPYGWSSIPSNYFGFQYPASGNAYSGAIAKWPNSTPSIEWIGSQLNNSLQPGTKYFISFKTSFAGQNSGGVCAINKIGVVFSTVQFSAGNPASLNDFAHIYADTVLADTTNWMQITGSFIADSNYLFINLGNFFLQNDSIQISGNGCNAYYYFDDVCVSTDSLYTYNYTYTGIDDQRNKLRLKIFPNPGHEVIKIYGVPPDLSFVILNSSLGQFTRRIELINNEINVSDVESGLYFIRIDGQQYKIVINHF